VPVTMTHVQRVQYSYNGRLIGTHTCPIEWYYFQWPASLKVIGNTV